mmetsp:Transcript_3705/g.13628  ORF Transcript_3705/g.13628 Transcript_3705/m.13628 type:complete len:254 (-) Transcript_3705:3781-4542(-)
MGRYVPPGVTTPPGVPGVVPPLRLAAPGVGVAPAIGVGVGATLFDLMDAPDVARARPSLPAAFFIDAPRVRRLASLEAIFLPFCARDTSLTVVDLMVLARRKRMGKTFSGGTMHSAATKALEILFSTRDGSLPNSSAVAAIDARHVAVRMVTRCGRVIWNCSSSGAMKTFIHVWLRRKRSRKSHHACSTSRSSSVACFSRSCSRSRCAMSSRRWLACCSSCLRRFSSRVSRSVAGMACAVLALVRNVSLTNLP